MNWKLRAVCFLLVITSIAAYATPTPGTAADRYAMVEVSNTTKHTLNSLHVNGFDVQDVTENGVEVIANGADRARLSALGFVWSERIPDMSEYYRQRWASESTDLIAGYPTFRETLDSLNRFRTQFPNLVSVDTIGRSLQGRPIVMMKISDNVTVDEDEPEVFFNALTHCREMITHTQLLTFARYLLSNYAANSRVQNIVNNRELYFVPVVNPDGLVYNETNSTNGGGMWRKNRRDNGDGTFGVDLNRNFGPHWGYDDVGSSPLGSAETYRGDSAYSEPETRVIREFVNSRHFRISLNHHSYSNYIAYPVSYRRAYADDHSTLRNLGFRMNSTGVYQVGNPWWLLYPVNGDAADFMYLTSQDSSKNLSYVIEIGTQTDGFWPQQSRIAPLCQQTLEMNLVAAEMAAEPRIVLPPSQPVFTGTDTIEGRNIEWTPSVPDVINPAVSYDFRYTDTYPTGVNDFETNLLAYWNYTGITISTTRHASGARCASFTNNRNSYKSYMVSKSPVKLGANDTLRYNLWYDTEQDFDYFFAQISLDDGVRWYSLQGNHTTTSNPNVTNWDHGITGSSDSLWVACAHPLAAYAGATVKFRFVYETDGGTRGTGVWIDDISHVVTSATPWTVIRTGLTEPTTTLANGDWWMQVRARDAQNDTSNWSELKRVHVQPSSTTEPVEIVHHFGLRGAYPNPFNPTTSIRFSLASASETVLTIHDVSGREVARLLDARLPAGNHDARWSGVTKSGFPATSGVYFIRLTSGSQQAVSKAILMK